MPYTPLHSAACPPFPCLAGDWSAYTHLVSPAVTYFEPEGEASEGVRLISGLEFHRSMFEEGAKGRAHAVLEGAASAPWSVSSMQGAEVRLLGPKHALVTYSRVVTPLASTSAEKDASVVAETRVWELGSDGGWPGGVPTSIGGRPGPCCQCM